MGECDERELNQEQSSVAAPEVLVLTPVSQAHGLLWGYCAVCRPWTPRCWALDR